MWKLTNHKDWKEYFFYTVEQMLSWVERNELGSYSIQFVPLDERRISENDLQIV